MKKHLTLLIPAFSVFITIVSPLVAMAQDYKDDIYYNSKDIEADKAKRKQLAEEEKQRQLKEQEKRRADEFKAASEENKLQNSN